MSSIDASREGGCLCGAIRYRVTGAPSASGICHCPTCRRAASAPSLPFAGFPLAAFTVTRGAPVAFQSSPHVTRSFCGRCGSPLTYRHAQQPESIDIMTASLDDPNALPPRFSVWTSEKLAWDQPAAHLPAYPQGRPDPAT